MGKGTPSSFGALTRQPPLTLEDQAWTNTQVDWPPPPYGAMTWHGHTQIHTAFHILGAGWKR